MGLSTELRGESKLECSANCNQAASGDGRGKIKDIPDGVLLRKKKRTCMSTYILSDSHAAC